MASGKKADTARWKPLPSKPGKTATATSSAANTKTSSSGNKPAKSAAAEVDPHAYKELLSLLPKSSHKRTKITGSAGSGKRNGRDAVDDGDDGNDEKDDEDEDSKRVKARQLIESIFAVNDGEERSLDKKAVASTAQVNDTAVDESDDDDEEDDGMSGSEEEDSDDDEAAVKRDSFSAHFGDHVTHKLGKVISGVTAGNYSKSTVSTSLGSVNVFGTPLTSARHVKQFDELPAGIDSFVSKQRLRDAWTRQTSISNTTKGKKSSSSAASKKEQQQQHSSDSMNAMQSELLNAFDSYMDVYYTGRTADNATSVRQSYIMHVLNHVNKTRDSIIRHSQKIAKQQDDLANGISSATTAEYRDQGFTRPRVLILVPYKNSAFDIVRHMIPLSGTDQQENKKRFFDEYALPADEDTGVDPSKPADFKGMFDGNLDDCFRTGIKFTRRAMKLSTDFYSSDVIIASPLGLRLIIGDGKAAQQAADKRAEAAALGGGGGGGGGSEKGKKGGRGGRGGKNNAGGGGGGGRNKGKHGGKSGGKNNGGKSGKPKDDYDFLSSIEMVIVDQCDALLMQNWEHVEHVFDHLNLIPQSPHGCDFSRVRSWCLDGNSKYLRQTIVLGNYAAPELSRLITKQSSNAFGRLTFAEQTRDGAVANVLLQIPQAFTRIDCASVEAADDRRFDHFAKHIAPTLKDTPQTIVVVPSYFDYIRVRNLLLKETGLDFAHLSEHSTGKEIARARTEFFSGFAPVLVITERFHFYHRYQIRGARNFIFYQLPENAHYYPEILNFALLPTNKSNQDAAAGGKRKKTNDANGSEHSEDDDGMSESDRSGSERDSEDESGSDNEESNPSSSSLSSSSANVPIAESRSCVVLFTKYDALRLARVTGDALAKRMISGDRLTYAFT